MQKFFEAGICYEIEELEQDMEGIGSLGQFFCNRTLGIPGHMAHLMSTEIIDLVTADIDLFDLDFEQVHIYIRPASICGIAVYGIGIMGYIRGNTVYQGLRSV